MGRHDHFHQKENGEIRKTVKRWFVFTVHVTADTDYELPVAFSLTRASKNEMPVMRKLLRSIERHRPHILEKAELFSGNRGYDDGKLIETLWRGRHIKKEGKSVEGRIDERATRISLSTGKVEELFRKLVVERMQDWMTLADERLAGTGIDVFMCPGNDDIFEIDDVIKASTSITFADGNKVMVKDFEMISSSWSNPTPWDTERECSEEELEEKLEGLAAQVEHPEKAFFNFHVPPYDTLIDQAPKLSKDLIPSTDETIPAGSKAVSAVINRHQPLLGLHGHIHESRGVVKLGRTQCFNPGSEYSEGILRGVILMLKKDKLKDFMFISG